MRFARTSVLAAVATMLTGAAIGVAPIGGTVSAADEPLVIAGVIDGPLPGGLPKAVEFRATADIADLSAYGFGSANNGGGSDGEEFTFPADALAEGQSVFVATEAVEFANWFGFAPDYTNGSAPSINGDDAIELFMNGAVIDVFGEIDVDGTGQPWDHIDGWAKRVDGTGPDGTTFALGNWTFSGPDALDGETTNATAAAPYPLASRTVDPVLNEFSASTTGTDVEYLELFATPGTDVSTYTVLEIEGDASSSALGRIASATAFVGTTDGAGLALEPLAANTLQNGTLTLLLVDGFSGTDGDAIDADQDGSVDAEPWAALLDSVSVTDSGAGDLVYSPVVLGPNYDGLSAFAPGGASRIPDGTDTDTAADWVRNDFDAGEPDGDPVGTPEFGEAYNTPGAPNELVPEPTVTPCAEPVVTAIHDVQGAGPATPLEGATVTVEGVVVGDFQDGAAGTHGDFNGFFLQEQDADVDADTATSEGIFVFDGSNPAVDIVTGDVVAVTGTATEYFDLTQISSADVEVCATGAALPSPATLEFPVASIDVIESAEGMSIWVAQPMYVNDPYNFARYGETLLGSEVFHQPTARFEPGSPEAAAYQEELTRSMIVIDDGLSSQNPDPAVRYDGVEFGLDDYFRLGDTFSDITGVLNYTFDEYKIEPVAPATYTSLNPRTAAPDDTGGSLTVASFNVLNYFNTLDTNPGSFNGPDICGPGLDQECRGANTAEERTRQLDKIVAAMEVIDADVIGVIEVENSAGVEAMADIVGGLNDATAPGTYAYVDTGTIGTDVIKQGFIYQPGTVTPVGDHAVLDTPEFIEPNTPGSPKSRPALAQTFEENATGEVFTAVVNHLKSKGSGCDGDAVVLPDDDPQAASCNLTRALAAQELVEWIATDPTGSGDPDVLVIGDLNSYDMEDPIDVLVGAGYTDLLDQFVGDDAYTYSFDTLGYLDYAMASTTLAGQVTGTTAWHINSEESNLFDYDTTFKADAQDAIYAPDPYASSDHDPVIVGLSLETDPAAIINWIADRIDALEASGSLNSGQAKSVNKSLDQALRQLDRGHVNGAIGILTGVSSQLSDFLADGVLTPEEADALIAAIDALRDGLS